MTAADFKKHLNPAQYAAVTHTEGPALVIAGAGSGKTRVIEYRVLYLLESGAGPESILLLSFTRKAAGEMMRRAALHNRECWRVDGGTFHSFAYNAMRKYAELLGFTRSFSILDEEAMKEAVKRCATKMGLIGKEKRFPKEAALKDIISASANKQAKLEDVVKREYPHFIEYAGDIEELKEEYTRYKINKNYVDYDDLLLYLRTLLQNPEIRHSRGISGKYKYIMVDEYQDTNAVQGDITYLLSAAHKNIMVVGDDAQGIYGFRGATHENIMSFPRRFSDCKIIKLEKNYRSAPAILNVANAVLAGMKNKYPKCLESARNDAGEKPRLLFFEYARQEADWIADSIKEFKNEGASLADISVLFRSAYVSIPLQAALIKRKMPYQIAGGMKFYETAHVKDVIAHLKVAANPKDEIAWARLLRLVRGVGPVICEKILKDALSRPSLADVVKKSLGQNVSGNKYSPNLSRLGRAMERANSLAPADMYNIFLDYYMPIMMERFDDWHLRKNDLEVLREIAAGYSSLEDFLADFAIELPEKSGWPGGRHSAAAGKNRQDKLLTLSTIHSAKGLEWKIVFLIGVADGVLPVSFALGSDEEIEEENRVFYVGITRAKDKLFLSAHQKGGSRESPRFNKISRFVDNPDVMAALQAGHIFADGGYEIDLNKDAFGPSAGISAESALDDLLSDILQD